MTYRDLTSQYQTLRLQHKAPPSYTLAPQIAIDINSPVSPSQQPQPPWMNLVDEINSDITTVKDALEALQALHSEVLKVDFNDGEQSTDLHSDINTLTNEINMRLQRSQNNLKKITMIDNEGKLHKDIKSLKITPRESKMRQRVMMSLAPDLQNIQKQFKNVQKNYMDALKEREKIGIELGFDDDSKNKKIELDDALERGLTDEERCQIQEMEQNASEREAEILRIAQSVNELATMFRELNVLVIEQGTILDRIDYNIEQTLEKVKQGTTQLVEAEKISRKAYSTKCLFVLVAVAVVEMLVLIVKKS